MSTKKRVALGMSGGVDSSVAAKILQDQGYEVIGLFMKLWHDDSCSIERENACCDEKATRDARAVANLLGIKFYVVNAKEEFRKSVVEYFINEYKNLRTPNPCIVCNEKIKFDWLLRYAEKLDCDYLATGHYARITCNSSENSEFGIKNLAEKLQDSMIDNTKQAVIPDFPAEGGTETIGIDSGSQVTGRNDNIVRYRLLKGKDENKDQSYFLYRLNQEQMTKVLFPIGQYTKPEVREMAKKWELPVYEKAESQEICFVDTDYRDFLRTQLAEKYFKNGEIVDGQGNIVGYHKGLINYTIGQRRGIEQVISFKFQVSSEGNSKDRKPLYVVGFNADKNQLIVGGQEDLLKDQCKLDDVHWINPNYESKVANYKDLKVKIRYRAQAVPCSISITDNQYSIIFDEPQRAVTPGQSAVLYSGDEVIGGGIIV